jgi:hypothetical protein
VTVDEPTTLNLVKNLCSGSFDGVFDGGLTIDMLTIATRDRVKGPRAGSDFQ